MDQSTPSQTESNAQVLITLKAILQQLTSKDTPTKEAVTPTHVSVSTAPPCEALEDIETPEEASSPKLQDLPEWISVDLGCEATSIGKTRMYDLLNNGDVHSILIRNKGCIRGMRRIHTPSLIEFMENQPSK
ncbi:hypothetical protein ACFPK9_10670 [Rubritalea spongiae]